jgi:superfamily II DNA or RNA helicase
MRVRGFGLFMKQQFLILICGFVVISLYGCQTVSTPTPSNESETLPLKEFNIEDHKAGGKRKDIQLLPHQVKPIEYLYEHTDVKGLIINHGLGTGKTFLGLGFSEKYPKKHTIILVPEFLISNWKLQMHDFGIRDDHRYEILSFSEAPQKLKNRDLKDSIVIIDEAHKFVQLVRNSLNGNEYTNLYLQIQSSYKILLLTGTPIYSSTSDLAYLFNLVAEKEVMPFNQEQFRNKYTAIDYNRSYFRGYLTESAFVQAAFPTVLVVGTLALAANPYLVILPLLFGGVIIPFTNHKLLSLRNKDMRLRNFDVDKIKVLSEKYVSYYEVPELDKGFYPSTKDYTKDVLYDRSQYTYYLDYLDKRLTTPQVKTLLTEDGQLNRFDDKAITIRSTALQEDLQKIPGSGREIGNISWPEVTDSAPPKFTSVMEEIKRAKGPVVVYSAYFENGIKRFASYLEKHESAYKNQYKVLDYHDSVENQVSIIRQYNRGEIKILLLHPEFTEGISLNGTKQLHLLEPVLNRPLFKQITGRVVRYKSHTALPVEERNVDIYVWRSKIDPRSSTHYVVLKENWQKYFSELDDYSEFGEGLTQIDPNAPLKKVSPDFMSNRNFNDLDEDIEHTRTIFKTYCIEHTKP